MNTIIHDPTKGWILLTEKWPEKPIIDNREIPYGLAQVMLKDYEKAVSHCFSTAIEIAKEDWGMIKYYIPGIKCQYATHHEPQNEVYEVTDLNRQEAIEFEDPIITPIQDHHPYSVDAEFEVKEQFKKKTDSAWREVDKGVEHSLNLDFYEVRQIARLVKASVSG